MLTVSGFLWLLILPVCMRRTWRGLDRPHLEAVQVMLELHFVMSPLYIISSSGRVVIANIPAAVASAAGQARRREAIGRIGCEK